MLLDHWELLTSPELVRTISTELGWPEPDEWSDIWVVDGESPRSLAEKIVEVIGD